MTARKERKAFSEQPLGVRIATGLILLGAGWVIFTALLGLWKLTEWLVNL